MGAAFRELGWKRHDYVVSTKLFWGLYEGPNMRNTLNRKYLSQAIVASLERFGLDFVDLVFCHRADPNTPIEETVWAMSDMVDRGQALYWGTSEWTADEIRAAWDIAERHNLHKPVMEQPAVQHPHARARGEGVRPPLRGHRARHDHLVTPWPRVS
jgi:aryl-alcohol dehydrogenase-like predicted oxidoreductase